MDLCTSSLRGHPLFHAVTAILLLLLVVVVVVLCILKSPPPFGGAPVRRRKPSYPPVAGTLLHLIKNLNRLPDFQTELSHKYKTFTVLAPFCNYVYTMDPANVGYILKTNFANYGKGDFNYDILTDFFGDGIFVVDGEKWRHQRKLASFEFSTKVLREYNGVAFRNTARKLAKIVDELVSSSQAIEIQDLFMKSTLDSIFKVGFGAELDTLSGSNKEGIAFAQAFDEASVQLLYRYFDVFWKVKRFLNIGSEATMKRNMKLIDDFLYNVIDRKIGQRSKGGTYMDKEDILSRFIAERERDPENITYKYLRDIVLNFVIAGKVAQEVIESTAPTKVEMTLDEFLASLTEEALDKMHYLHSCLAETLRLYPAVPVDVKCCFSDDTLPDGFDIKKGDNVNYLPYAMGRMDFLWGEDAAEFRPKRWINDDGVFMSESPFKFTAFQAGPRICLGREFAYKQMKILAATLVYFFMFKLLDESRDVKGMAMVTLQITGGLHLYCIDDASAKFVFVGAKGCHSVRCCVLVAMHFFSNIGINST